MGVFFFCSTILHSMVRCPAGRVCLRWTYPTHFFALTDLGSWTGQWGFSFPPLHAASHLTQRTSLSYLESSSRSYSHSLLKRQSQRTAKTCQNNVVIPKIKHCRNHHEEILLLSGIRFLTIQFLFPKHSYCLYSSYGGSRNSN